MTSSLLLSSLLISSSFLRWIFIFLKLKLLSYFSKILLLHNDLIHSNIFHMLLCRLLSCRFFLVSLVLLLLSILLVFLILLVSFPTVLSSSLILVVSSSFSVSWWLLLVMLAFLALWPAAPMFLVPLRGALFAPWVSLSLGLSIWVLLIAVVSVSWSLVPLQMLRWGDGGRLFMSGFFSTDWTFFYLFPFGCLACVWCVEVRGFSWLFGLFIFRLLSMMLTTWLLSLLLLLLYLLQSLFLLHQILSDALNKALGLRRGSILTFVTIFLCLCILKEFLDQLNSMVPRNLREIHWPMQREVAVKRDHTFYEKRVNLTHNFPLVSDRYVELSRQVYMLDLTGSHILLTLWIKQNSNEGFGGGQKTI